MGVFDLSDENVVSYIPARLLQAALKLGDENLYAEIKAKVKPLIEKIAKECEEKKGVSVGGFFIGMERWQAELWERYNDYKGVGWKGQFNMVTRFSFSKEYIDSLHRPQTDLKVWVANFVKDAGMDGKVKVFTEEGGRLVVVDSEKDAILVFTVKGNAIETIDLKSESIEQYKKEVYDTMKMFNRIENMSEAEQNELINAVKEKQIKEALGL